MDLVAKNLKGIRLEFISNKDIHTFCRSSHTCMHADALIVNQYVASENPIPYIILISSRHMVICIACLAYIIHPKLTMHGTTNWRVDHSSNTISFTSSPRPPNSLQTEPVPTYSAHHYSAA
jgi:hypothetical protein